jgi:hypothetical protein
MAHNSVVTLNVTAICLFLLGACVPIHILVCKKNCIDYAANVRRSHTTFSHMDDLAHVIGASLVQHMVFGVVMPCNLIGGYRISVERAASIFRIRVCWL